MKDKYKPQITLITQIRIHSLGLILLGKLLKAVPNLCNLWQN